ncbi:uncharacterized protein LOC121935728 [Sceloporus undulatus]|uniref:uncharacterized protein LOC121935728 n=1 Tax=Sceloporus undulatus TaxID=8520 RepID=UPI001C4C20EA|nr:uncharacterized protein LOC121935728 [Sceloporus undulatus]
MRVIKDEWSKPATVRPNPSSVKKFYSLPQNVMTKLQIPLVDAPVSSLVTSAVYARDGEESLKLPEDKRADSALKRCFEASSTAIRAASSTSILTRAAHLWAKDLMLEVPKGNTRLCQGINKLLKVLAFAANSSLDIVQFSSRAQAASIPVRRCLWLKNWQVNTRSKQNLTLALFSGTKLFGEALDPVLIETKDKKKALPSTTHQDDRRPSCQGQQSFRYSDLVLNYLRQMGSVYPVLGISDRLYSNSKGSFHYFPQIPKATQTPVNVRSNQPSITDWGSRTRSPSSNHERVLFHHFSIPKKRQIMEISPRLEKSQ